MLARNEFSGQIFEFDPKGVNTDFDPVTGERWLEILNFPDRSHVWQSCTLIVWWSVYMFLTYFVLKVRVTRRYGYPGRMRLASLVMIGAENDAQPSA